MENKQEPKKEDQQEPTKIQPKVRPEDDGKWFTLTRIPMKTGTLNALRFLLVVCTTTLGALIGLLVGGPIGAAIGAAIGLVLGGVTVPSLEALKTKIRYVDDPENKLGSVGKPSKEDRDLSHLPLLDKGKNKGKTPDVGTPSVGTNVSLDEQNQNKLNQS